MLAPVTVSWEEMGFDGDEMEESYRPWTVRKGKKRELQEYGTTDKNYADWWKTRSKMFQDKSIGPVRADMVRSGKIKFADLVDKKGNLINIKNL